MQLDIDPNGLVHLTLEPDEQINVQIGSVEVVLIGGIVGTLGEGPLVQIMLQEPTARLEMKHFTPHSAKLTLGALPCPRFNGGTFGTVIRSGD